MSDEINYDDVDEVIGLASRMRQESQGRLTAEEMAEIGAELGIPAEYVDQAREELSRRRAEEERAEKAARARRNLVMMVGGGGFLLTALVFGLWSMVAVSSLQGVYAQVEAQAAEVQNVEDRREAILELYADRPDSVERDAEIVGSENRIRVARQRYNEAVAVYNQRAARFPASLWTGAAGLPDRVEAK